MNTKPYFDWLVDIISDGNFNQARYHKLLVHLYSTDYTHNIIFSGDIDREKDGINLRSRFTQETGLSVMEDDPCTMLEMMVALAIKCEICLMEDLTVGTRIGRWFWEMIQSLGLRSMSDSTYDENYVDLVIHAFMSHRYAKNGEGSLFTIKDSRFDMRNLELWKQMSLFTNEQLGL